MEVQIKLGKHELWVLTGEGEAWMDRGTWCTHTVLGVYTERKDALLNAERVFIELGEGVDEHALMLWSSHDDNPLRLGWEDGEVIS